MTERELAEALFAALQRHADAHGDYYHIPEGESEDGPFMIFDGQIYAVELARILMALLPVLSK